MTHFLTGACLGRSGFNRKTGYATLAMTLAAEAPDIDVVWGIGGPVTGFAHHRGITHTFVGAPVMALIITALVWVIAKLRPPRQPVRWAWIYALALLADGSHLLLDWTNNYGLRPFYPFNGHWYAGSFVFIFEPVMFALLLLGLLMPALLGLVEGEMRRARPPFRGRGWAIAALAGVGVLYGMRGVEHARALTLTRAALPSLRVAAEPVMVNPFRWHTLAETRDRYQSAIVDTRTGTVDPQDGMSKPPVTSAVTAAKASYLGRVYGDWSSWLVVEDVGSLLPPGSAASLPDGTHTVEFRDLRFAESGFGGSDGDPVLGGWVVVDGRGRVVSQWMSGRQQR